MADLVDDTSLALCSGNTLVMMDHAWQCQKWGVLQAVGMNLQQLS